jgi:raffinose/stachyose/melibiose transport system permease protein
MKRYLFTNNSDVLKAFLSLFPALFLFVSFLLYPQFMNLGYSVTNFDGFSSNMSFVGLANFRRFFLGTDAKGLLSLRNTFIFSFSALAVGIPLQMSLALALYGGWKGSVFFKSVFYIPAVISLVVISVTWNNILQFRGLLNQLLVFLGGSPVDWLGSVNTAMGSFVFINAWQFTGYGTLIYLAGLNSIPEELFESATLDGARGFTKFFYITLPLMAHSITVGLFMGLTGSLQMFVLPFIMTGGGPLDSTLMTSLHIYNTAFRLNRFGYAAALSVIFMVIIASITIIQMTITRKREVEY